MLINKGFVRRNKTSLAILLFLAMMFAIHYSQPSLIYFREGGFRPFGVGYKQKTVIPMWAVALILAILSYTAVSWYLFL